MADLVDKNLPRLLPMSVALKITYVSGAISVLIIMRIMMETAPETSVIFLTSLTQLMSREDFIDLATVKASGLTWI
jgi:hypothetical protein